MTKSKAPDLLDSKCHEVAILCTHNGENSGTRHDPTREYTEADAPLLTKKKFACRSSDDDREVEVLAHSVARPTLPTWLSVKEYCNDNVKWTWTWAAGVSKFWPERWQRRLARLDGFERYILLKLLGTKNFRSKFREEMRDKVVEWLNEDEPKYSHPLSDRQFDACCGPHDQIDFKRWSSNLYYARR